MIYVLIIAAIIIFFVVRSAKKKSQPELPQNKGTAGQTPTPSIPEFVEQKEEKKAPAITAKRAGFCENCGAPYQEGTSFCEVCGSKL
ncbi:MAG: zinc ribbon domain-containing protein [Oscillospiraceae bacterium]|nr:zinc ribbon domain-containing protein [Oscillospiraceae bacterium]